MKSSIEVQLYPTGLEDDDNTEYLAFLDKIMTEKE
jgi:hypothetical protein